MAPRRKGATKAVFESVMISQISAEISDSEKSQSDIDLKPAPKQEELKKLTKSIKLKLPKNPVSFETYELLLDAISQSYVSGACDGDEYKSCLEAVQAALIDVVVRLGWTCEEFIRVVHCVVSYNDEMLVSGELATIKEALDKCTAERLQILGKSVGECQESFRQLCVFMHRSGWFDAQWLLDEQPRMVRKRAATPAPIAMAGNKRTKTQPYQESQRAEQKVVASTTHVRRGRKVGTTQMSAPKHKRTTSQSVRSEEDSANTLHSEHKITAMLPSRVMVTPTELADLRKRAVKIGTRPCIQCGKAGGCNGKMPCSTCVRGQVTTFHRIELG